MANIPVSRKLLALTYALVGIGVLCAFVYDLGRQAGRRSVKPEKPFIVHVDRWQDVFPTIRHLSGRR